MADTGAPWNIPYVENADLVKDYPTASLALANAIASGLDAAGPAGIGSNVVQAVKTDTFSTTSTSFTTVTGLSVTITPTTNTSKILLLGHVQLGAAAASTHSVFSQFSGGNTAGFIGDAAGSRIRAVTGQLHDSSGWVMSRGIFGRTMVYLDSPATTSATTYNIQIRSAAGSASYVNRSGEDVDASRNIRGASSFIAIEVAA